MKQDKSGSAMAQAVARAEAAFKNGQLSEYKPLTSSKSGTERPTSFAAWGSNNKR
jgi:hypothetical protein